MVETVQKLREGYVTATVKSRDESFKGIQSSVDALPKPDGVSAYPAYIKSLREYKAKVEGTTLDLSTDGFENLVHENYRAKIVAYGDKVIEVNNNFEMQVSLIEDSKKLEAIEYNAKKNDELNISNQTYIDLEEKRKTLAEYEQEVLDLCSEYAITTSDIPISNSSFTLNELDSIYEQYIEYMESRGRKQQNVVSLLRDKVQDNTVVEGILLLGLIGISFTVVLDLLAVIAFILLAVSMFGERNRVKSYSILLGLIYNVRPMEMGFKDTLTEDERMQEDVDPDELPEIQAIAVEWENALNALEQEDPEVEYGLVIAELEFYLPTVKEEIERVLDAFSTSKKELLEYIDKLIVNAEQEFEDKKAKMVRLGDAISTEPTFNTKFVLGVENEVLEKRYELGLKNILMAESPDPLFKEFVSILLANAICSTRPGKLKVTIFDPVNRGELLINFFGADVKDLITLETTSFDDVMRKIDAADRQNLMLIKDKDINTYNTEADAVGKTLCDYKLFILLSQTKELLSKESYKKLLQNSARHGIFIWAVTPNTLAGCHSFVQPFASVKTPMRCNPVELGERTIKTLVEAIESYKGKSLSWDEFCSYAMPEDQVWTGSTNEIIDIIPGFHNGDPTDFKGYSVGHTGDIHGVIVGGTGAGKSIYMHFLINTVVRKYSPKELELWLVDFKGAEMKKYLGANGVRLPHLKTCLCTSDSNYAGSVFKALRDVAQDRYAWYKQVGVGDLKTYNKKVRAGLIGKRILEDGKIEGVYFETRPEPADVPEDVVMLTEADCQPRILLIVDEFQVIFRDGEPDIIEQVKLDIAYLASVARACGVHMIVGSQSMNNTLKPDTLQQFSLRMALRCDKAISQEILGTTFASDITEKNGYLYVRSATDKSLELQKRWRTPFFSDDDIKEQTKFLYDKAVAEGYTLPDVIEYEESRVHRVNELEEFYEKYGKQLPEGTIILGPRMTYSTNKAPDNITLSRGNNNHLFACIANDFDLVDFYRQLMYCVKYDTNATVFVNCQSEQHHYLLAIEQDVEPAQLTMSGSKMDVVRLMLFFLSLYEERAVNKRYDDPVYIILIGWDKAVGFGIDRDYDTVQAFQAMLQKCGELNMHFIFIVSDTRSVPQNITVACKYTCCTQCSDDASSTLLGSGRRASKADPNMKNGYIYLRRGEGTAITRCKLYRSKKERKVKADEFVLGG